MGFFLKDAASHLLERRETAALSKKVRCGQILEKYVPTLPFLLMLNLMSESLSQGHLFLDGIRMFYSKFIEFPKMPEYINCGCKKGALWKVTLQDDRITNS